MASSWPVHGQCSSQHATAFNACMMLANDCDTLHSFVQQALMQESLLVLTKVRQ